MECNSRRGHLVHPSPLWAENATSSTRSPGIEYPLSCLLSAVNTQGKKSRNTASCLCTHISLGLPKQEVTTQRRSLMSRSAQLSELCRPDVVTNFGSAATPMAALLH